VQEGYSLIAEDPTSILVFAGLKLPIHVSLPILETLMSNSSVGL